MLKLQNYVETY